jgi:hypothetical protein
MGGRFTPVASWSIAGIEHVIYYTGVMKPQSGHYAGKVKDPDPDPDESTKQPQAWELSYQTVTDVLPRLYIRSLEYDLAGGLSK